MSFEHPEKKDSIAAAPEVLAAAEVPAPREPAVTAEMQQIQAEQDASHLASVKERLGMTSAEPEGEAFPQDLMSEIVRAGNEGWSVDANLRTAIDAMHAAPEEVQRQAARTFHERTKSSVGGEAGDALRLYQSSFKGTPFGDEYRKIVSDRIEKNTGKPFDIDSVNYH